MKDGQSFGISGILDHRTTDTLSKMPGIGDIPILGQLFRSKNLNRSTMELVVIVTPKIIDTLNGPEGCRPADACDACATRCSRKRSTAICRRTEKAGMERRMQIEDRT